MWVYVELFFIIIIFLVFFFFSSVVYFVICFSDVYVVKVIVYEEIKCSGCFVSEGGWKDIIFLCIPLLFSVYSCFIFLKVDEES